MNRVTLTVPGQPVPKQRARKGKRGWYTPRETLEYAETVRNAWLVEGKPAWGGARVALRATFWIARAPSTVRKDGEPRKAAPAFPRFDFDNLLKAVTDPLTGLLYDDDRQVVSGAWSVMFCQNGDEPRACLDFAGWA